eukprot:201845_1
MGNIRSIVPSNDNSKENRDSQIKILMIGARATGKSSIIRRYVFDVFDPNTIQPTVGVDYALKKVRVEDTLFNVHIWDIAGQETFSGLQPTYYRQADGAIIVFDITNKDTLNDAEMWKKDIDDKVYLKNGENIPVILFANKIDTIEPNEHNLKDKIICDEEIETFCTDNSFISWFKISGKTGLNIEKGMNFICGEVVKTRKRIELEEISPTNRYKLESNRINIDSKDNYGAIKPHTNAPSCFHNCIRTVCCL